MTIAVYAFLASVLGTPVTPPPPARPKLVLVITVDQLRPDYFTRWKTQLTGGLGQLMNEGAFFTDGYQDHAMTETAPGHSTILSGMWPAHTGIIRNSEGVQDSTAPLIGTTGPGASPRRVRGTELFDWLKAVDPTARALSVSRKDRGAILPIGQSKQQVYWYQSGLFTTSRYYADSLPAWVLAFNARRLPFKAANTVWTLLLPDRSYKEDDNAPWENLGSDVVFPHRLPADSTQAAAAVAGVPAMDSLTLLFALEGFEALRLGRRGTDVLAVSLSTTDAVGHAFGPDSREIHDQVLRLDRYLSWFLKRVTDRVGRDNVIVVLTADHGVTSFPERTRAKTGGAAYRVLLDTLITAVNRDLDRLAGAGGGGGGGAPRAAGRADAGGKSRCGWLGGGGGGGGRGRTAARVAGIRDRHAVLARQRPLRGHRREDRQHPRRSHRPHPAHPGRRARDQARRPVACRHGVRPGGPALAASAGARRRRGPHGDVAARVGVGHSQSRSEERRVGKEGRSR